MSSSESTIRYICVNPVDGSQLMKFQETVYVFDNTGTLVTRSGYTAPTDEPSLDGTTVVPLADRKAPAVNSRKIFIRIKPSIVDPRFNQTILFSTIVQ